MMDLYRLYEYFRCISLRAVSAKPLGYLGYFGDCYRSGFLGTEFNAGAAMDAVGVIIFGKGALA